MKLYCISCGAGNDWVKGVKPTICSKCKKSINGAATPIIVAAKPVVPSLAELLTKQTPSKHRVIELPSVDDEDNEDENFNPDLVASDSIKFQLEMDRPNSISLGDALANPAPPPPKRKGAKITKASLKRSMNSLLKMQKTSKGNS